MRNVLTTTFRGYSPDASGHPLAPPELVYETSEPDGLWERLAGLSFAKKYALFCVIGSAFFIVAAIIQLVSRYSAL